MDPRGESQPWPAGTTPTPAWTKELNGKAYTIKPIDARRFGIWRDVEELGIFELSLDTPSHPIVPPDVTLEARSVIDAFLADPERHAATREG